MKRVEGCEEVDISQAPLDIPINQHQYWSGFGDYYIYIIYTPNLGLAIAVFDQEREHGRFRGSSEGAAREQRGSTMGQCAGA